MLTKNYWSTINDIYDNPYYWVSFWIKNPKSFDNKSKQRLKEHWSEREIAWDKKAYFYWYECMLLKAIQSWYKKRRPILFL
jgi:hypothetical protein